MIKIIGLLLLFCLTQATHAQHTLFYDCNQIGSQSVNAFCQDADRFLWIATNDGLRRFDGSRFVAYQHDGQDSTSLADNEVLSLLLDNKGNLWVGTIRGLQRYLPETDRFQTVRLYPNATHGHITDIIQRKGGEILFAASGMGVFRLDAQAMTARKMELSNQGYNENYISRILEDQRQRLWLGTERQELVRVNMPDGKEKVYHLPTTGLNDITEGRDGTLYAVTNHAIYAWNEKNDSIRPLPYHGTKTDFSFTCALPTSDGHIVVGTNRRGLVRIAKGGTAITDMPLYNPFTNADQARVSAFLEDRGHNLWIGDLYQGILMRPAAPMLFHFMNKPSQPSETPGQIAALCTDQEGTLWCSVEDAGIYRLTRDGKIARHIPLSHTAKSLFEDSNGTLWAGINGKGLYTLNPKSGQLHLEYPLRGDYTVNCITEDANRNLYASILGEGILCRHLPTGESRMFPQQLKAGNMEEFINAWVISIFCDSKGRIWTCHYGGISCYDTRARRFLKLPFPKWMNAYCAVEGKDGRIWIGTRNGLICHDPASGRFTTYTTQQGMPDNIVYGLAKDKQGGLWCSTAQGIAHISSDGLRITNYYTGYGLKDLRYVEGCFAQGRNGTVFFGGEKGITAFNPDNIRPIKLKEAPCITGIFLRNQKVTPQTRSGSAPVYDKDIITAEVFRVAFADNDLTFHISTMDYRDARNIIYEYRMQDLEKEWNRTQPGEAMLQYHHLAPGTHTLQIRACENGIHSPIRSVQVVVAPPWYLSTTALIAYTLLIIGIGSLVYIAVKRKRQEQIGEMKLQFFINIAHELRSSLTLITNPLERLLKKGNDPDTDKALQTIRYNAHRILNLLNQLLDIRKIDKGQMRIRYVETDMTRLVNEQLNAFSDLAQQKGISLETDFEKGMPAVWVDPGNFDKVLANLLSNALKYTPRGGKIKVKVVTGHDAKAKEPLRNYMEIAVADTGNGLDEKEIKKIFERFYQGAANRAATPLGFGIGLNLCQLLVRLHHGTIFAENRKDTQGSRFVIRLPLGCRHMKKEETETIQPEDPVLSSRDATAGLTLLPAAEKPERSRTSYHVLVIDDDEELRDYLKTSLSRHYHVDTAANGDEGWQKAVTRQPDLIVSDVVMPGIDGFQLLKELKKNTQTNHIPIILLTSKTEFASRMEGLEQGADGYLCKPFRIEELDALMENLIANRIRLKGKFSGKQAQEEKVVPIEMQSDDEILMERVMKVINENIANSTLNVEQLATEVGMSRAQLYRRMKDITGLSASDFIRDQRLRQAAKLLKKQKSTVTQIAYAVGFTSQAHFSTMFKRLYGMSPTEYMENEENG